MNSFKEFLAWVDSQVPDGGPPGALNDHLVMPPVFWRAVDSMREQQERITELEGKSGYCIECERLTKHIEQFKFANGDEACSNCEVWRSKQAAAKQIEKLEDDVATLKGIIIGLKRGQR